jgi:diguanylate cyclase (GGDEF)-like protein
MDNPILRILLVEDDEDDYLRAQAFLSEVKEFRAELTRASTAAAALEQLQGEAPDVILADYHLGGGDGLEFVHEATERGYPTPIVVLTEQGDKDVDVAVMKAGAVDYLEKDQITAPLLERTLHYAMRRAQMLKALSGLAIHDALTGLYNRREFNRLLEEEFGRCRRYGHPLALLMLDVDHFKTINDTQGHMTGDDVLRQLALGLREKLRTADRPARYSGDEFAFILPETDGQAALIVADRIGQSLPALLAKRVSAPFSPTLSIGVAELPGDSDAPEGLIEKAAQALGAAKRRGGNCVVPAWLFRPL